VITSRDNATLTLVRKLLSHRKHREEEGLFAAEGEDLVRAAARAGVEPVHLLVAGETVAAELLARVSTLPHPARTIGVYRRDDLPRGVRDRCLALWRLADPGNVGTLIRTADAFGACVALSPGCADPLSPKALRASAGASFRVPLVGWDERPSRCVALVAHGGAPLGEADLTAPVTLLLGAEREGLPAEQVTQCYKVTIPLAGQAESLNVAAAGAIALYEAAQR
jgi:TrmH family RNA methyltransferase